MLVLELCKKIGIENFKDLMRFKAENCPLNNDLASALLDYLNSLGKGFKVK